ncbi:hypothetical protein DI44_02855 [Geobacillus sp. CAMR5420]|jgi:hypothetical protein|nr:hypothetical protein GA8_00465 [Geobacillus sp. A8]KDE50678.1 hypothetical protein DI44_02855 [Geobacillus sp. CAMR5420]
MHGSGSGIVRSPDSRSNRSVKTTNVKDSNCTYIATDAITLLLDMVNKEHKSFAILALATGFTADELERLEKLFYHAGKSQWDKDTFVAEFEKQLPKRSAMLRSILEGLKSDGKFVSLCEKYLD